LSFVHDFYSNKANRSRGGNFYALNSDYKHVFGPSAHDLSANFSYRSRIMEEESITRLIDENNDIKQGMKITEDGPSSDIRVNVDYKYPISETNKFELGYQNSLGSSVDKTSNADYDLQLQDFVVNELYVKDVDYQDNIQSAYALYSGELGSLGYQGGLRAEYTYRKISLKKTNEEFKIDRWDYFPTLHFSFKFNEANQFIASYTKRISRPHGGELEPFETWTDAYSVRKGNPELNPEDIDSYEIGYQHYFSKNLFSIETYYRITNDKIEDIQSVYPDYENVILSTVYNIGKDYSFGTEAMLDLNFIDWWKINLSGNLFNYEVTGVLFDEDFSRKSTNWRTRFDNSFSLTNELRLQINASYNSPTISSQGRREGFVSSNFALRYKLLEYLTATLQFRDLFSSSKNEFTSEGANFYNYNYSVRKSPEIMLNLNFNINNFKQEKNSNEMGEGREDEDF
jgi:outer membrane cobalamin receptor